MMGSALTRKKVPLTQMVSFSLEKKKKQPKILKSKNTQAKTKHDLGLGLGLPIFNSSRTVTVYLKDVA